MQRDGSRFVPLRAGGMRFKVIGGTVGGGKLRGTGDKVQDRRNTSKRCKVEGTGRGTVIERVR